MHISFQIWYIDYKTETYNLRNNFIVMWKKLLFARQKRKRRGIFTNYSIRAHRENITVYVKISISDDDFHKRFATETKLVRWQNGTYRNIFTWINWLKITCDSYHTLSHTKYDQFHKTRSGLTLVLQYRDKHKCNLVYETCSSTPQASYYSAR